MAVALRDRIAYRLINAILRHIATPWYRDMIYGAVRYGFRRAVEDERQDV